MCTSAGAVVVRPSIFAKDDDWLLRDLKLPAVRMDANCLGESYLLDKPWLWIGRDRDALIMTSSADAILECLRPSSAFIAKISDFHQKSDIAVFLLRSVCATWAYAIFNQDKLARRFFSDSKTIEEEGAPEPFERIFFEQSRDQLAQTMAAPLHPSHPELGAAPFWDYGLNLIIEWFGNFRGGAALDHENSFRIPGATYRADLKEWLSSSSLY